MQAGGAPMDELVARSGGGEIDFALTWLDGGPLST